MPNPLITVEHVSSHQYFPKIVADYRAMWEHDPGEERAREESDNLVSRFLDRRGDVITVAAFRHKANGEKEWIGSAIGYAKRPDHAIEPEKQATIASVFVDEKARKQGAATLMVQELQKDFKQRGFNSIQLYASPEGAAVYKKCGFTTGDEMRLKKISSLTPPEKKSSVFVREADFKNPHDRTFIINQERKGSGVARTTISNADALKFIQSSADGAKRTAFIAYQQYGKVIRVIRRALGLPQERRLGSAVAGLWDYPVPDTFRPEIRRDLFVPALRNNVGNTKVAQDVYMALIAKLVEHAKKGDFTQINVQKAGAAQEQLRKAGFGDGIHMYQNLPTDT